MNLYSTADVEVCVNSTQYKSLVWHKTLVAVARLKVLWNVDMTIVVILAIPPVEENEDDDGSDDYWRINGGSLDSNFELQTNTFMPPITQCRLNPVSSPNA